MNHVTHFSCSRIAVAFLLCFPMIGSALAQDADEMAKQAAAELRKGQSVFFNGKAEQALAHLETAEKLITEIEAKDSGHGKLASLKNSAQRLRRDVERKLGKDKPPAEEPQKPDDPAPPAGDAGAKKLPSPVAQALQAFDRSFESVDRNLASFDPSDPQKAESMVGRIDTSIRSAQMKYDALMEEAEKRGFADHPDVKAGQQRIADASKRLEGFRIQAEGAAAAAAEQSAGATADAEALMALRDRLRDEYQNKAEGLRYEVYKLEKARECLTIIHDFEQRELAAARKALDGFGAKYGTTKDAIDESASNAGYEGGQAGWAYENLAETIKIMADLRPIVAEELVKRAEERMSNLDSIGDLIKIEYLLETKEFVLVAAEFEPENAKVKEELASIDPRVQEFITGFYAKIDKIEWKGHADNAPSNADELAKAAKKWFENSDGWGKRKSNPYTILDVKVTGPWSVQANDLLGRPIMYGLPVRLAVQLDSEKDIDLSRVFALTLRTEEGLDAKKAPPFSYPTVGGNHYIRASTVLKAK